VPSQRVRPERPQPGAMTARQRVGRRDVSDEIVDKDRDGSNARHRCIAIADHVEPIVEVLPRSASAGDEDLDVVGHARDQLRAMLSTDERTAVRVGEQHRGLGEPAAKRETVWRLKRTRARAGKEHPPEAHLETAHPTGIAVRAYGHDHAGDPYWRGRRERRVRRNQSRAVDLPDQPAREDVLARDRPVRALAQHTHHQTNSRRASLIYGGRTPAWSSRQGSLTGN